MMQLDRSHRCSLLAAVCSSILGLFVLAAFAAAQPATPQNLRLPESDTHYRAVKDWIEEVPQADYQHPSAKAYEAFRDIKYGVRIHWGIYSIWAQGNESWPMLRLPFDKKQEYQELYKTWNPNGFDAEQWMKLFKDNGLQMFAFTAKHHEGFSMFDTKTRVKQRINWTAPGGPRIEQCDLAYSIMETPFHRDVVKELCDAGRKYGLKIDLYFSHPDWYDADFRPYGWHPALTQDALAHPDLYGKALITSRTQLYAMTPDVTAEEEARMLARHRAQLVELLSNYGPIDMMCLDNWFGPRVWPQTRETIKLIRKIQPDVMLRARGIGNYGDYYTPEGFVPGNKENTDMPWFVIYPLGSVFSYDADATKYKGGQWIIRNLVDSVAKGGRFMVGIGPDVNGRFHPKAIEQLEQAGIWLKTNGPAIYGSVARAGQDWQEGDTIRFTTTRDGQTIYAICLEWPGKRLALKTVRPKQGSKISLLGYDQPLAWTYSAENGLVIELPDQSPFPAGSPLAFAHALRIEPAVP
jgi:alpha-L-fucosidase